MSEFESSRIPLHKVEQTDYPQDVEALYCEHTHSKTHQFVFPRSREGKDRRDKDNTSLNTIATRFNRNAHKRLHVLDDRTMNLYARIKKKQEGLH